MQAAPSLLINGTLQGQAASHHPYSKNASGMLATAAAARAVMLCPCGTKAAVAIKPDFAAELAF